MEKRHLHTHTHTHTRFSHRDKLKKYKFLTILLYEKIASVNKLKESVAGLCVVAQSTIVGWFNNCDSGEVNAN